MTKEIVYGERTRKVIGETFGPYSHAVKTKGSTFLFIAGETALVHGEVIGKGDIGAQYMQIMANMQAILEDAGGLMSDIVKLVNYVVPKVTPDSPEYAAIRAARTQYIPEDPPVSTMVQVAGLMIDDLLVEVDAIAVLD